MRGIQVLLAFGAVAMIVGFLTLGHRTIKLIAQEITVDMSPISGFAIELGTAFTVLVCVKIGKDRVFSCTLQAA